MERVIVIPDGLAKAYCMGPRRRFVHEMTPVPLFESPTGRYRCAYCPRCAQRYVSFSAPKASVPEPDQVAHH